MGGLPSLNLKRRNIGYGTVRARYPALFVSYCSDDGRASKLFPCSHRDEKGLLDRARSAMEWGIEKQVLEALNDYHEALDAPKESFRVLDKLAAGAAMVVTGQQPSVGGGPMYDLYKGLAAVKYAQAISSRGVPCVAAFWNHSDDVADGGAVSLPNAENRVTRIAIGGEGDDIPLYRRGTDGELETFVSELVEALPKTEFHPWVEEVLRSSHRGNVAESFSRTMLRLLGPFGLIVLEPRLLEGERSSLFFSRHKMAAGMFSMAVEEGRRKVKEAGFADQLGREVGADLFEIYKGRRRRVGPTDAVEGRLVAGVALRPLLQDAILPTCATVAGPSELGYLAELGEAYPALGIEPTVVIPRVTATLLEPKVARLVERAELKPEQLFGDESSLVPRFMSVETDIPAQLLGMADRWVDEMDEATSRMQDNEQVARARKKTSEKVRQVMGALAGRVEEEQRRSEETGRGRLAKLLTHVRPGGELQERVFTPFYYLNLCGSDFVGRLFPSLDPFVFAHALVEI